MKKSKLKAEIKISKFWRKKYKKKLNELVIALNETKSDLDWYKRKVATLEIRLDNLNTGLSSSKIGDVLVASSRFKS